MSTFEQDDSYPMQTIKLPLPLPVEMLPGWLMELTHEVDYHPHQGAFGGYQAVIRFKPETHAQILRAEILVIEVANICEEERQKQQEQGENHERE
ncbi:hypothetical protein [Aeromonas veronii]|uniref:hypothetical protein n=1 Tax=Aeromonas veronii TaxID=654 RepID=UPI00214DAE76|nr:hypothetical protein [Aeromonas veronii]MCR3968119.1 hypothetical protein [Aeromonas veronii]MCR3980598.1 hypothetical protein [Aeromonas veronii]